MRDQRKMKNKYELKLDNRQIVVIFLGFLLYSILILTLGVMIGKGLETAQPPMAEEEKAEPEPAVTAQAQAPTQPPGAEIQAAGGEAREAEAGKPATSHVEYTFYDTLKGREKPEPKTRHAAPEERPPAPVPAPEARPEPAVKERAEVAPARQEKPKKEEKKDRGGYTIQVSAQKDKSKAAAIAKKLVKKGYPAYVVSAEVKGKGSWHRVRVGSFKTKEAAQKYAKSVARKAQISGYVIVKAD